MRLNKYIANNSNYSRKTADLLLSEGRVKINGIVVTPTTPLPTGKFKLTINNKPIFDITNYTVIVYNKPKGEIVSKTDPQGRKTIFHSLSSRYKFFTPVGRLDYASEGLLLLSDSKRVASKLMESSLIRKYIIKIDSKISKEIIEGLNIAVSDGLDIEDARAGGHEKSLITSMHFKFDGYEITKSSDNFSRLKVSLSEGKNRELRRFFAYFKANVLDLKRVSYGFISLNNLPVGKTRFLTKEEYKDLHEFLGDGKDLAKSKGFRRREFNEDD
ncbi:pseudouridine synthase [Helicobacter sp. 13S00401-1]|uniref:pseudouridine synthase n=1 Tax=Helicobacter sp. 13S00401-1 TaxID=1905758 RepID=UPI000BA7427D|nr:pseudouridine synthase [Helicobacter sp. 13S00401-1]PAF50185.1 pseudouridine synthase [Helicobacter sp. 13S00401-1]